MISFQTDNTSVCFFSKRVSIFSMPQKATIFDYLFMSGGESLCSKHKKANKFAPGIRFLGAISILLLDIYSFAMSTPPLPNRLKPNVIIILTDDQGYADLGVFGSADLRTPNIDRMAQRGAPHS